MSSKRMFALLFSCQYVYCFTGDPVMYLPPFEVRTVKGDRPAFVGNQGTVGNQGIVDNQGFTGNQGFNGNHGFIGNQGFNGNQAFNDNQVFVGNQAVASNQGVSSNQATVNNQQSQPNRDVAKQQTQLQPIVHTNMNPTPTAKSLGSTPVSPPVEREKVISAESQNFTFTELLDALNDIEAKKEDNHGVSRASEYGYQQYPYDYRPGYQPEQRPYGYQPEQRPYGYQPGHQPYGYQSEHQPYGYPSYQRPPYSYHESSSYVPPEHHSGSKLSLLKPDLSDLVKPVTTKVAGKVSGLIGLVLTLLTGSSPNDVELKGFKDIVVNGIVKPLLLAKGGIKTLVSKLTIPVIALLLINLEVLVTMWWLWEDCPDKSPPPYNYPKPNYGYNSYR